MQLRAASEGRNTEGIAGGSHVRYCCAGGAGEGRDGWRAEGEGVGEWKQEEDYQRQEEGRTMTDKAARTTHRPTTLQIPCFHANGVCEKVWLVLQPNVPTWPPFCFFVGTGKTRGEMT